MNKVILLLVIATATELGLSQNALSPGKFAGGTYENDALGFSYPLPDGFVPQGAPRDTGLSGSRYLFVADARSGWLSQNRILLAADDANQYSVSLKDYAAKMTRSFATQPETVLAHDLAEVEFASRIFYRSDFDQHSQDAVLFKSAVWSERRGCFLTWFFVAHSEEELNHLINSLGSISFHDNANDLNAIAKKTIPVLPGKRVKVPESDSKALIVRKPSPSVSLTKGRVVLKVIVDPHGVLREVTVVSGNGQLTSAAMEMVQQYRFKPYVWQDHRVEMETQITITFDPTK